MNFISLLIGIFLSSLLLTAAAAWFFLAQKTFQSHQSQIQSFDAGQRSIQMFMRDIQSAGYRGPRSGDESFPLNKIYSDLNPSYDYFRQDRAVFGFMAKPGNCFRKMPHSACQRAKENSPVLIIYNIAQKIHPLIKGMQNKEEALVLPSDQGIHKGALVLIADVHQGDLWIANRIEGSRIFHDRILKINQSPSFSKAYSTQAEVVELQTVAYYLARPERFQDKNKNKDSHKDTAFDIQYTQHMPYEKYQNHYALFRDDFVQNAQEVLSGVAHVEFEYGLQNASCPDSLDTANSLQYRKPVAMSEEDWALVQVIRIHLCLSDPNIHHKTWTFEIRLRNGFGSDSGFSFVEPDFLDWDPYGNAKFACLSRREKFF